MKGSIFLADNGDVILPEANEVIRQRNFTLEGYTLDEQVEEINK